MKRFCLMLVAAAIVAGWPSWNFAQEGNATADRYDADERYRRLDGSVNDLIASQSALQQRLAAAREEIQRLRDEVERSKVNPATFASAESLHELANTVRELAKNLKEIDEKRQADKKLIMEAIETDKERVLKEIKALAQLPPPVRETPSAAATPAKSTSKRKTESAKDKDKVESDYTYTIQKGDNLSKIVSGLRKDGVKITLDQLLKANPGLTMKTPLYVGKKLNVPAPAGTAAAAADQ